MNIRFNYEYDCGGHVYEHNIDIEKEEFENDKLLMLVCAYMQTWGGYPGKEIDEYLHNRFPNVHTTDDMLGFGLYNVYSCEIDGLKDFYEIADGELGLSFNEGKEWIKKECRIYNENCKGKRRESFSIWN